MSTKEEKGKKKEKIQHVTFAMIEGLESPLKVLWEFKLLQHVLIIKVSLS